MKKSELNSALKELDERNRELNKEGFTTSKVLQAISSMHLDWGIKDEEFDQNYDLGTTKSILLSGLVERQEKLRLDVLFDDKKPLAKMMLKLLNDDKELTSNYILEIHSLLFEKGGKIRTQDVRIEDSKPGIEQYLHFMDAKKVKSALDDLVQWYQKEKTTKTHPIILIGIFHVNFVRIHPFLDGNGRIARILLSLLLLKYRIPPPDMNKEKDRGNYLLALRSADSGDIEPFLLFLIKKIISTFEIVLSNNSKNYG